MTEYYAVKEADCTPEQIKQIYSLFESSMGVDSEGHHDYEPNRWQFIVFEETEEIYQCLKGHLNEIRVELITPEEAIQRLFETYLEN